MRAALLWIAVVFTCVIVLLLRYPAEASASDCNMVRHHVQSSGLRTVRDVATSMGYTRVQMLQFRRYCARMGIYF